MPLRVNFEIENPLLIAGADHAREQHNAALPEDAPALTTEEYVAYVGRMALVSWARNKVVADWEAGEITKAAKDATLAALGG